MTQRLFSCLLVVFAAVFWISPALALKGKVAALAGPGTPWERQWVRHQAYLAENAPDIQLEYFTRGELGNEDEMLAATRRNRVQIMGPSLQGMAAIVPEFSVAMAPYLFESPEEVDFVYDNYLFEPASRLLGEKGLVLLQWSEVGWTDIYANKEIRHPDDARDLKLRAATNISAQVFLRAIGASAVPVGSVDIVPALQTGLVKGGTSNMVFHYYTTRQYATHVTLTHHAYDTGSVVANKKWFDAATPEQQQHLIDAFGPSDRARQDVRDLVEQVTQEMKDEGIIVLELNPEERAVWIEKTKPLVQDIISEVGGGAQMVYDAILEGKQAFKTLDAGAGGETVQ